jgi:hypothetical protein
MNGETEDAKSRRFLWGVLLVWGPFILVTLPGLFYAFRGVSEQRATGMGAIAGIMAEGYATFGLIVGFAFQVYAIILLVRTFSKEHLARGFFSIISISCSVCTLLVSSLSVWAVWALLRHHP